MRERRREARPSPAQVGGEAPGASWCGPDLPSTPGASQAPCRPRGQPSGLGGGHSQGRSREARLECVWVEGREQLPGPRCPQHPGCGWSPEAGHSPAPAHTSRLRALFQNCLLCSPPHALWDPAEQLQARAKRASTQEQSGSKDPGTQLRGGGGALPAPPPPAPSPPATSPLSFLSDRLRRSVFGFDSEQSGLFQAPVPSPRHARWSCVPASVPPCHSPSHPGATQAHDLSARHQWTCVGWQDLVITTRVPGTLSRMPPTLKRLSLCSSCQLPAGASRLCAGTPVPAASPGDAGVRFPGTNEPAPLPGSTGPSDFLITRGWPCGSLTAFLPRCLFLSFFLWIHRSLGALHEWLKNT